jgi:hypothetical protein
MIIKIAIRALIIIQLKYYLNKQNYEVNNTKKTT